MKIDVSTMMHCFSTRERVWSICFILLLSVTIPTTSQQSFPLPMTIPWSDSIKVGILVTR